MAFDAIVESGIWRQAGRYFESVALFDMGIREWVQSVEETPLWKRLEGTLEVPSTLVLCFFG